MTRVDMNPPALSRALTTLVIVVISLFLALIVGTILIIRVNFATTIIQDNSEINKDALQVILALSGCTVEDTVEECQERQRMRSVAEGQTRIKDLECRIRLALAGKPSPDTGTVCTPP